MAGVKGKSGRKPNERVVRHFLGQILDEEDPETGRKRISNICEKLVKQAEGGDVTAAKEVFDRLEGKPAIMGPGDEGQHIIQAYGWLPVQD